MIIQCMWFLSNNRNKCDILLLSWQILQTCQDSKCHFEVNNCLRLLKRHASKLHMIQNGSWVSKSVSWKIEENSSFSTKPAPLKIKNDYSDRMLLVGGYITLCKCRIEVQEDTNYFQHQQQWWEQLFLIHGKSEFLWLMKVLNG